MARDAVIALNAGSTSLKFGIYGTAPLGAPPETPDRPALCRGQLEDMATHPHLEFRLQTAPPQRHEIDQAAPLDHAQATSHIIDWARTTLGIAIIAAGHRVVLGGPRFTAPVQIDDSVLHALDALSPIEPGHQAINLAVIRAARASLPDIPHIACFDTGFHRTMPDIVRHYALPPELQDHQLRHWGYHGISYEYITRHLAEHGLAQPRVIIAHLGGGASLCAVRDGKSIETSMGLSSLSGLPMATRSGDLPPELILHLLRTGKSSLADLETQLYHQSGLAGLSGRSGDMRDLQHSDDPNAVLAIAHFVYAILKFIGAYTAILGGLDALVFTGGIGEHQARLRATICHRLAWLGLTLDPAANETHAEAGHAQRITTAASRVAAYVIPTDEERVIAGHTLTLIAQNPP